MDELLFNFVKEATTVQKGVFLLVSGVCFVFLVQFVFFMIVKIWPKGKSE